MLPRRTAVSLLVATACIAVVGKATAAEEGGGNDGVRDAVVRRRAVHEWYGGDVAALYGIGYGAGALGLALSLPRSAEVRTIGFSLIAAGVVTPLIGVPATHFNYGNDAGGFWSLGGQLGGATLGIGLGIGFGGSRKITWAFRGALIGHATWAVADVLLVARRERVLSVDTELALAPVLAPLPEGGATLGAAGAF